MFVTVFTRFHHASTCAQSMQSTPPTSFLKIYFNIIISSTRWFSKLPSSFQNYLKNRSNRGVLHCFVFGMFWVRISAPIPGILTDSLRGFTQSLQETVGVHPKVTVTIPRYHYNHTVKLLLNTGFKCS